MSVLGSFIGGMIFGVFWMWLTVIRPINETLKTQSKYLMASKDTQAYHVATAPEVKKPTRKETKAKKEVDEKVRIYDKAMLDGTISAEDLAKVEQEDGVIQ